MLLTWDVSRSREYVADRGSALIIGASEELMSSLVKIGGEAPKGDLRGGPATSALCVVTAPPQRRLEFFTDQPRLGTRIRRLEEMARKLGRPAR